MQNFDQHLLKTYNLKREDLKMLLKDFATFFWAKLDMNLSPSETTNIELWV